MMEVRNNIELKFPTVRARCMECKEENFIDMKFKGTEKEQRNLGFEYEHIFKGKLKCVDCGEKMRVIMTIFEYPKGFINYHDTENKSCLLMSDLETKDIILNR